MHWDYLIVGETLDADKIGAVSLKRTCLSMLELSL